MTARILPCGCVETDVSIGTCPECLPVGSIEHMIEDGRQLSFEGLEPLGSERGTSSVRAGDGNEKFVQDPSETLIEIRSIDPSF